MTHYDILHFFCSDLQLMSRAYTVCTPPFLLVQWLNFQPSFQKDGGLAEPQLFLFRFAVNVKSLHIVCTLPPCLLRGRGGVELPTKFSKRGWSLVGPQLLERVARKEEMTFFTGAMQFSHIQN